MLATNTHILFHEFDFLEPTGVSEAAALLAQHGQNARPMAGGTDLLVQMKMERRQPQTVISLARIPELKGIAWDNGLTLGATTSIRAVYDALGSANGSGDAKPYAALAEASNWFSTVQIMYMATVGGNLCNASPASDTAPCLLVFDAVATLVAANGSRTVPLAEFFVGPGKTVLRADELLTRVHIPRPPAHTASAFVKLARVAADISQVCTAVRLTREGDLVKDARIALGSVAPTPVRAPQTERALLGQRFTPALAEEVARGVMDEIQPIDDVRASRDHRLHTAATIVSDALVRAWERTLS